MKKYLLAGAAGLLLTAGVTATVLNNGHKKTTTKTSKTCPYHHCIKGSNAACY